MSSPQEAFEQMLISLSSPDNASRKAAEEAYHTQRNADPLWTLRALLEVGCNSTNEQAGNMALVLLRKVIIDPAEYFLQLPAEEQESYKALLLQRFGTPGLSKPLLKAAASCVSNLAAQLSIKSRNAWPTLWPLLMQTMGSAEQSVELRGACCDVFEMVGPSLGEFFQNGLSALVPYITSCMQATDPVLVAKCMNMVGTLAGSVKDDTEFYSLAAPCAHVLQLLSTMPEHEEAFEDASRAIILMLSESQIFTNKVTAGALHQLVTVSLEVARNPAMPGPSRHLALEIVVTAGEEKRTLFKNNRDLVESVFHTLFQYMQRPVMEDDWAVTVDAADEEASTDFDVGAQCMDRLSKMMKGKVLEDLSHQALQANLFGARWEDRVASLTLLTYTAEGCRKQFANHLQSIVESMVLPNLAHEHPYVRYSAVQCLAQFSEDFMGDNFQERFCGTVLPPWCDRLGAAEVPRVRAIAAAALSTFLDPIDDMKEIGDEEMALTDEQRFAPTKFIEPFLAPLCNALGACVDPDTHPIVLSESLNALSSLIQVAESRLRDYTHALVPAFSKVLFAPARPQDSVFVLAQCRAIECTTLLASFVKKESFGPYAADVCNYLMSNLQAIESAGGNEDRRLRFILRGWTCMVECIGEEVLPYMAGVVTPLLALANMDCDAEMLPAELGAEVEDTEHVRHMRVATSEGEKIMRVHTSRMEDKSLAITIVMAIVQELKSHMYPYLSQITDTALKLLTFQSAEDIRDTAADVLSSLAVAYKPFPAESAAFFLLAAPPLLAAFEEEEDPSVCMQMSAALTKMLQCVAPDTLTAQPALDWCSKALKKLHESCVTSKEMQDAIAEAAGEREADDEDDEDDEDLHMEHDLQEEIIVMVGELFRAAPAAGTALVAQVLPAVTELTNAAAPNDWKRMGLCLLCELVMVDKGGRFILDFIEQYFLLARTNVSSTDSTVAQPAWYAISLLLELVQVSGHASAANVVTGAVTLVREFFAHYQTLNEEDREMWYAVATNAMSVAVRAINHFGAHIDAMAVFSACAPFLPAGDDEEEAAYVHNALVEWLKNPNHPILAAASPLRALVLTALKKTTHMSVASKEALAQM